LSSATDLCHAFVRARTDVDATAQNCRASLELTFQQDVPLISEVRRFVAGFCQRMAVAPDAAARVAMAAHELLENSVLYSIDGKAHLSLSIVDGDGARHVRIRSANRTAPEQIARVRRVIAEMNASTDPSAFYVALLRRTVHQRGSGLGLARIFAEGEMTIGCEQGEGDVLAITAQLRAAPPGGGGP
jgi:anti-sigma regulatory factor (Ser/Thr protein kinase)